MASDSSSMVFPLPLPVIMTDKVAQTSTLDEQKSQTDLLRSQQGMWSQYLQLFGLNKDEVNEQNNQIVSELKTQNEQTKDKIEQDTRDKKKNEKGEKLKDKLAKFWDKIKFWKYFPDLFKNIKEIAKNSYEKVKGWIEGLAEWFWYSLVDPSGSLITTVVSLIIPMLGNLVTLIMNMLGTVIPQIINMVIAYLPQMFRMIEMLVLKLVKMAPMFINALVKAIPIIIKGLVKVLPVLVKALIKVSIVLFKAIIVLIPVLLKGVWEAAKGIWKELVNAWPEIKTAFVKAMIDFKNDLFKAFPDLKKTFDQISDWFDFTKGDFTTKLKELVTGAWDTFKGLGDLIYSMIGDYFGPKTKKMIEGTTIALGLLLIALGIYKLYIIGANIVTWILNGGLMGMVAAMWALVAPILPIVLGIAAIIAAFVLLYVYWDEIVDWLNKAWPKFKETVVEGFTKVFTAISDAITKWWTNLKDLVTGWWKSAKDSAEEVKQEGKEVINPQTKIPVKQESQDQSLYNKTLKKTKEQLDKGRQGIEKFRETINKAFNLRTVNIPNIGSVIGSVIGGAFESATKFSATSIKDMFKNILPDMDLDKIQKDVLDSRLWKSIDAMLGGFNKQIDKFTKMFKDFIKWFEELPLVSKAIELANKGKKLGSDILETAKEKLGLDSTPSSQLNLSREFKSTKVLGMSYDKGDESLRDSFMKSLPDNIGNKEVAFEYFIRKLKGEKLTSEDFFGKSAFGGTDEQERASEALGLGIDKLVKSMENLSIAQKQTELGKTSTVQRIIIDTASTGNYKSDFNKFTNSNSPGK
jgi:phage-related protein